MAKATSPIPIAPDDQIFSVYDLDRPVTAVRVDHRDRGVVHEAIHAIRHGDHAEYAHQFGQVCLIERARRNPARSEVAMLALIASERSRIVVRRIKAHTQQRHLVRGDRSGQLTLQACELAALDRAVSQTARVDEIHQQPAPA